MVVVHGAEKEKAKRSAPEKGDRAIARKRFSRAERSGREPLLPINRSHCRLADDPPQLSSHAVEHRALFLHALGVIVDLAGYAGHDLLRLLAGSVIKALRDPGVVKP